ncbi:Helicase [Escherichia coli]|uniref:Helicase n=1 Tax=Escherichia coli TaxID=562 RepID=A0A3S4P6H8_ECOLX|nr:Helicase [Escherichia coli]
MLYKQVSSYLQRDDLLAIKSGARHLVTLVIRKILASSSTAIQGTLETMIHRLESKMPVLDALERIMKITTITAMKKALMTKIPSILRRYRPKLTS